MNKLLFIVGLHIGFALLSNHLYAQKTISHTNQQWIHSYQQYGVSEKINLLFDVGYRMKESFSEPRQFIVRSGIAYSILPNLRIAAGIAYADYFQASKLTEIEYRFFQDIQTVQQLMDKFKIEHRLRVEERFIHQTDEQNDQRYSWRFRYKLGGDIRLFRFATHSFSLYLGNELFINAGKHIVYNIFDQNRLVTGISLHRSKNLSASLLYNYQFSAENKPGGYRATDILWLSINSKLNLKAKRRS